MNRRGFLTAGCACCALLFAARARAQSAPASAVPDWKSPARLERPSLTTDEGGLWAIMDREETRLRRSPFAIRDAGLHDYIQGIVCRLVADHCPDIRVHVMHTPLFNANVAPNGMVQVWSGLLLRIDNEAQFAAVIGHELGHYLQRHTVESMRDAKSRAAFAQFLGLLGLVGAVGQLAVAAGAFAFSRDHEREADRIGVILMRQAGYDATEAAKVWENLLLELKARPGGDPAKSNPLFATHPPAEERNAALAQLAASAPGGVTNEETWRQKMQPFRREWLRDEVKRGQYDESIALLTRLLGRDASQPDLLYSRAESYRLRAKEGDSDLAVADYLAAIGAGHELPETHRGLGLLYRQRKQLPDARASFARYLELAPDAPDSPMIKSYVEDLGP